MKPIIHLIFLLLILASQSNVCKAQKPTDPYEGIDSLTKSEIKIMENAIREHNLHKDNKDSAWINDFDGNVVWDSRSKSKEGKALTITDSITNSYYILDSTHTVITAFDKSKNIIWKTDPRKANSIREYRHKNPVITYFKIGKIHKNDFEDFKKGDRVIYIRYSNSQFGFLEMNTGKFIFEGQD